MICSAPPLSPRYSKASAAPTWEGGASAGGSLVHHDISQGVPFADGDIDTCQAVLSVERSGLEGGMAPCPSAPLRVLLVDDNGLVAKLLAVLLRLDGHDVQIARNGCAALCSVRTYRPQVVLLDIDLPDMSGYEVAFRLRSQEDTKTIFLAAVTGYARRGDRDEASFDCHLTKPVEAVDLRRLLASVANGRKEVD